MPKFVDLAGLVFGNLTVIERAKNDRWGHPRWLCRCVCGNRKIVNANDLKRGRHKSCGCLTSAMMRQRRKKRFPRHGPPFFVEDFND